MSKTGLILAFSFAFILSLPIALADTQQVERRSGDQGSSKSSQSLETHSTAEGDPASITNTFLPSDEKSLSDGLPPSDQKLCALVVQSVEERLACIHSDDAAKITSSQEAGNVSLDKLLCKASCFLKFLEAMRRAANSFNSAISSCCSAAGGTLIPYGTPPDSLLHMCTGDDGVRRSYMACMNKPANVMIGLMFEGARAKARKDLQTCLGNCNEKSK